MTYDYAMVLERLEAGDTSEWKDDARAIMALLGYQVEHHVAWGLGCYEIAGQYRRLQSLPRFNSADDFELWVIGKGHGTLEGIGQQDDELWYAGFVNDANGNDFGYGKWLGTAMWASFVALVGEVERPA